MREREGEGCGNRVGFDWLDRGRKFICELRLADMVWPPSKSGGVVMIPTGKLPESVIVRLVFLVVWYFPSLARHMCWKLTSLSCTQLACKVFARATLAFCGIQWCTSPSDTGRGCAHRCLSLE